MQLLQAAAVAASAVVATTTTAAAATAPTAAQAMIYLTKLPSIAILSFGYQENHTQATRCAINFYDC